MVTYFHDEVGELKFVHFFCNLEILNSVLENVMHELCVVFAHGGRHKFC